MDDDILTRLRSEQQTWLQRSEGWWDTSSAILVGEAADEIEPLQIQVKNREKTISRQREEIERLMAGRNRWEAAATGIAQDLSNTQNKIEQLQTNLSHLAVCDKKYCTICTQIKKKHT